MFQPNPKEIRATSSLAKSVERVHHGSRKQLFMPLGSKGFPAHTAAYTGGRVTIGIFEHHSEPFEIRENRFERARQGAHLHLGDLGEDGTSKVDLARYKENAYCVPAKAKDLGSVV